MAKNLNVAGILQQLQVPADFARYENITEHDVILRLEAWKKTATTALFELRDMLVDLKHLTSLGLETVVQVVAAVIAFDGDENWIDNEMAITSREVLALLSPISKDIPGIILNHRIKPLFLFNPHPSLNLSTGRKLPRPAGGSMAMQDTYEDQVWKMHPGTGNTISWCLRHITCDAYDALWHLLIPPVMTFLDDFQAPYKLKGINLISEMLINVPGDLIRRTGVGHLLLTSLSTTLSHLHDDNTPVLIRCAVPVILRIIDFTTAPGSADRFDKYCHLLGDNIIGGIWIYASRDRDTIEASLDVLPGIIQALGIGSVRYLKGLIPQCLQCISHNPFQPAAPLSMQLSALKNLCIIINECEPRIHRWKGAIIEVVSKYWVIAVDAGIESDEIEGRPLVVETFKRLAKACPSVTEDEYSRLLRVAPMIFESILDMPMIDLSKEAEELARQASDICNGDL